jgi:hypothetical protein
MKRNVEVHHSTALCDPYHGHQYTEEEKRTENYRQIVDPVTKQDVSKDHIKLIHKRISYAMMEYAENSHYETEAVHGSLLLDVGMQDHGPEESGRALQGS